MVIFRAAVPATYLGETGVHPVILGRPSGVHVLVRVDPVTAWKDCFI
jgi:hypothetical protein